MVDPIIEIPLPGRTLASQATMTNGRTAEVALPAFVAGPENCLVAATFCRLLENADGSPTGESDRATRRLLPAVLALFGPSGTGKTHLARGLVAHWQRYRGPESAAYVTAQDFRREFMAAMNADAVIDFRRRIRGHLLLAIDDLHRLPDDDYLLQELRYTLDALEENGGILVVTSNRPASMLANMPPDLRGRLAAGLMLQLAPPSAAARLRIVRHISAALGWPLSDDAVRRLADGVRGTTSQLLGALFKLTTELPAGDVAGVEHADQLLATRAAGRPTLGEIVAVVAKYYKLPQKQIKSSSRKRPAVLARATVVYLARELTANSYEQIGRSLGGRDHTTIMHNYQKIERQRQQDLAIQEALEDLRRILLSR